MGFLSGAYGKLMAGRLVRDLQHQMTSVQSRLRRVTREIGQKEKMYQAQERNMKLQMQNQMQSYITGNMAQAIALAKQNGNDDIAAQLGVYGNMYGMAMNGGNLSSLGLGLFGTSFSNNVSTYVASIQQQAQMQYTQSMTMWQNMQEMQKQADLDALHDLEQDLQTEKDNLESRLAIAKEEYDAKKQEEKDGAKSLQPDYTGQG